MQHDCKELRYSCTADIKWLLKSFFFIELNFLRKPAPNNRMTKSDRTGLLTRCCTVIISQMQIKMNQTFLSFFFEKITSFKHSLPHESIHVLQSKISSLTRKTACNAMFPRCFLHVMLRSSGSGASLLLSNLQRSANTPSRAQPDTLRQRTSPGCGRGRRVRVEETSRWGEVRMGGWIQCVPPSAKPPECPTKPPDSFFLSMIATFTCDSLSPNRQSCSLSVLCWTEVHLWLCVWVTELHDTKIARSGNLLTVNGNKTSLSNKAFLFKLSDE